VEHIKNKKKVLVCLVSTGSYYPKEHMLVCFRKYNYGKYFFWDSNGTRWYTTGEKNKTIHQLSGGHNATSGRHQPTNLIQHNDITTSPNRTLVKLSAH
jgi:hypothetical protein